MKKVFVASVLLLLVLSLISFVIAQEVLPAPVPNSGQTNAEVWFGSLADFLYKIFSGVSPLDPANSSRILLGVLLWMILYSVVDKVGLFKDLQPKSFWVGVISFIITILSFIYLPKEFVQALAVPYSAIGATILTFIPFMIIIYFTVWVTDSIILARTIWGVFLVYYFSIFVYTILFQDYRADFWSGSTFLSIFPYLIVMGIGGFIFFNLRNVRLWVFKSKIEEAEERGGRLVRKAKAGAKILSKAADEFGYEAGGGI